MLVRTKRNRSEFAYSRTAYKEELYIVYAVEKDKGRPEMYYVIEAGIDLKYYEDEPGIYVLDPERHRAKDFIVVTDRVSGEWITKSTNAKNEYSKSFPEWFENLFWANAHDLNLDHNDENYEIMARYKVEYEKTYEDLIKRRQY